VADGGGVHEQQLALTEGLDAAGAGEPHGQTGHARPQQEETDQVPSGPSFVVVVAIDFGTTSSGYAYAFTKEPECIHTMR
jgi:hypothetical protein